MIEEKRYYLIKQKELKQEKENKALKFQPVINKVSKKMKRTTKDLFKWKKEKVEKQKLMKEVYKSQELDLNKKK